MTFFEGKEEEEEVLGELFIFLFILRNIHKTESKKKINTQLP